MKKTNKKKESRFVRAWKILWERDEETPAERSRRRERRTFMLFLLPVATTPIILIAIMAILSDVPFWNTVVRIAIAAVVGVGTLVLINFIHKWIQKKYGED